MKTIDLVTSALAPEEASVSFHDPIKLCDPSVSISLEEVEQVFSSLPERLRDADPSEIPLIMIQAVYYKERSDIGRRHQHLLFNGSGEVITMAARHRENPSPETLENLITWASGVLDDVVTEQEHRKLRRVIGSKPGQINILLEFFEDDLANELSSAAGVAKATAKRWIDPETSMNWSNAEVLRYLAKIFYGLKHERKMTREEAVAWYHAPFNGGDSPAKRVKEKVFVYYRKEQKDELIEYANCAA